MFRFARLNGQEVLRYPSGRGCFGCIIIQMNRKLLIAVVLLMIVLATGYFWYENDNKKGLVKVAMCGNTFTTDIVVKDGVDVGQRIALLATQEYEQASQKDHTNCYFLKDYEKNSYLPLVVTEELSAEPNLKGKIIYLINMRGDQYIVNRESNEVYNVNAIDGSTRNVIGSFK